MIRVLLYTAAGQAVCGAVALLALAGGWTAGVVLGVIAAPGEVPGPDRATWLDLAVLAGPATVPVAAVVAIAWHAGQLRSRACGAEREAATAIGLGPGVLVGGLLLPWLPWLAGLDRWARDAAPDAAARSADRWIAAVAAEPQAALEAMLPAGRIAVATHMPVAGGRVGGGRALLPLSDHDCLGVAWQSVAGGSAGAGDAVGQLRFAGVTLAAPGGVEVGIEQATLRLPRTTRVLGERAPAELGARASRQLGERWRRARLAGGDAEGPARLRSLLLRRALVLPVTVLACSLVAALGLAGRRAVAWPAWGLGLAGVLAVVALPRVVAGWWAGAPA